MTFEVLLPYLLGPYGVLVLLLLFVLALGTNRFFVTRASYDREVLRVDRYDDITVRALEQSKQALDNQQRIFAEHGEMLSLLRKISTEQDIHRAREERRE